jgi:hypothetical protein
MVARGKMHELLVLKIKKKTCMVVWKEDGVLSEKIAKLLER